MGAGKHHVSLWEKACQALKGDRNDGDGDDDDVGDDGDDDGGHYDSNSPYCLDAEVGNHHHHHPNYAPHICQRQCHHDHDPRHHNHHDHHDHDHC